MAYREKTFNADTLTDLLSTYLSHKNVEREKYYQAELKRKPTYKAFGDELLKIGPSGDIQDVVRTKTSSSKNKLDTLYKIDDGSPLTVRNIKGQPHFYDKASNSMKILPDRVLSEYSVDKPTQQTKPKYGFNTWYNIHDGTPTMVRTENGKAYKAHGDSYIEIPPNEFANYTDDRPRVESVTSHVNWRRETADGWETQTLEKGLTPDGDGWEVGTKPTTAEGFVNWRKKDGKGGWLERTVKKGVDLTLKGYNIGDAPKKEYTPVTYHKISKDGRSVAKTFKTRSAELAGIDDGWIKGPAKAPEGHITWSRLNDAGTYDRITERVGIHPGKGYFKGVLSDPKTDTPDSVQTAAKDLLRIHSEVYPGDSETKKRYTELVSGLKTKDDYNKFKLELNKEGGKWERRKTRQSVVKATNMVKGLTKEYEQLKHITSATSPDSKALDLKVRRKEKQALQLLLRPYGKVGSRVYILEDHAQLKKDFIKQANITNPEELKALESWTPERLFGIIDLHNQKQLEKGEEPLPFYLHSNRFKGYGDLEILLKNLGVDLEKL